MPPRLRRLRRTAALRALVRRHHVRPVDLVLPVFVDEAAEAPVPIASMPGVERHPLDGLAEVARQADAMGLGGVLVFGVPGTKDEQGSQAWADDGVAQRAVRTLREVGYHGVIFADVCLCEYTAHGHCGVLGSDGSVRNDASVEALGRIAVSLARAGADVVAPSAMMDGMVAGIRADLDGADCEDISILSYSVKFASAFYGPFRDAAGGAPRFGDRRSHQMDPGSDHDAMREHAEDAAEGADMLMVKPGLAYLDVLRATRDRFPHHPLAAYNVSGEYSMVKAAAERGWLDERTVVLETLTAFRRAGADMILTYHALDAARWLAESENTG